MLTAPAWVRSIAMSQATDRNAMANWLNQVEKGYEVMQKPSDVLENQL
ncbi:MAG: hypothetical protein M2R45_02875 [Verrucomicrobia subdivision 3 bacterium]|nr:hypothetical protein [Limisphaerales bacterium]MCS1414727.1 hypothetical protein [Limisphaerales bacterium]